MDVRPYETDKIDITPIWGVRALADAQYEGDRLTAALAFVNIPMMMMPEYQQMGFGRGE